MSKDLIGQLTEYTAGDAYPFHMPGHKRSPESGPLRALYEVDITEIDGFDNLHQPEEILLEAQKRAASLYGSEETYFLINGSTCGILSAVSAVAHRGKILIMARNCHKAVYHAAFINHLDVEYIYPKLTDRGLAGGISAREVEEQLLELAGRKQISPKELCNTVAGIVITSPTYDGISSDVKNIVFVAHRYGIPVIVDQAHGAHFGFHPAFPESAVKEGADLVIHSVHKTLPAPTQTALLHRNGDLTDGELVRKYLRIYQTSSPSYPLMAGIDFCMKIIKEEGKERLERLLQMREDFLQKAEGLSHIKIDTVFSEAGKLLLFVEKELMTGREFYDILRDDYHLQMEMCGGDYVLAILTMMDREEGFNRLATALWEIDEKLREKADMETAGNAAMEEREGKKTSYPELPHGKPEVVLPLHQAYVRPGEVVSFEKAVGRIAAEFINLYPPGIPLLVPGEMIGEEMISSFKKYLENGYTIQGIVTTDEGEAGIKVLI